MTAKNETSEQADNGISCGKYHVVLLRNTKQKNTKNWFVNTNECIEHLFVYSFVFLHPFKLPFHFCLNSQNNTQHGLNCSHRSIQENYLL